MSPLVLREAGGSVTVTDAVLAQIVAQAVESVEGARLHRHRRRHPVALEGEHARAELELAVAYGCVLPDVARAVQERVARSLEGMCGLVVDAVDVSVDEVDR